MIGVWIEYEGALFIFFILIGSIVVVNGVVQIKNLRRRFKKVDIKDEPEQINLKGLIKAKEKWYFKTIKVIQFLAIYIFNVLTIPLVAILVYNLFFISPGVQTSYPSQNQPLASYDIPIYIIFDRPINGDNLQPYIFPEVKGEWQIEPVSDLFPFVKRKVVFYPEESMFEGKVFIYYAGLTNIFGTGDKWEYGIDSQAVQLPSAATSNTDNNTIDFPTDGKLDFILDQPYGRQVEFEFVIDPTIAFVINKTDNTILSVDFDGTLAQSKEYKFSLYKIPVRYNIKSGEILERGEKALLKEGSFTTVREPLIQTIEPNGSEVKVDSRIKIIFDQPMLEDSVRSSFSLLPSLDGVLQKIDDYTFVYDSINMQKETKYEVKLAEGIKSLKGGYIEKDLFHSFTTIGKARVNAFSPANNSNGININTNISVFFNQEVDHASAQSKFSISPSVDGSFYWDGNTMVFNPSSNLGYFATYTVNIESGVTSLYGINSNESFRMQFTTAPDTFILNVPIYWQVYRYSCNFVATAMAVAYKTGSTKDPMNLYNQVAKDTTSPTCDPSTQAIVTWGNPYTGYVGDVYGNPIAGCNRSGYGVYWGPVSAVISNYRSNSVRTGWNVTDMLTEVQAGNPVVIWAHNGYSYAGVIFYWQTPGGTTIRAVSGMHSYVVVGYIGSVDNPTSIILNDPNRGRWTISTSYFLSLWSYFNNSGIVVY